MKILHHNSELKIKPYSLWVTFAQNFIYIDCIWKVLLKEAGTVHCRHANWTSTTFEKYVVMEALVRRHEPVYVSQYWACHTNDMPKPFPGDSQLGDNRHVFQICPVFPIKLTYTQGWSKYTVDLYKYHTWGEALYRNTIPNVVVNMEIVGQILIKAKKWYNDDK